jgi:hypothetical protein
LRSIVALVVFSFAIGSHAQWAQLPDAPEPRMSSPESGDGLPLAVEVSVESSSIAGPAQAWNANPFEEFLQAAPAPGTTPGAGPAKPHAKSTPDAPVDANGNPIPLERQQPRRILGFMPNFRTVSGGAKPPPPTWKNNFIVATHQATDYSTFIFLGLTSLTAEGLDMHPSLGKGAGGFYAYTWRGFLDKTDGTYLSAWLLPSLLHEDTRYYALGKGHPIPIRVLYIISRQGVARTYGGRQTPNFAGLGGKVLTQVVSRYYYPTSATSFSVLASKFGYSVMRDVMFSTIREFYPDLAAHYIKKHREKVARKAAK